MARNRENIYLRYQAMCLHLLKHRQQGIVNINYERQIYISEITRMAADLPLKEIRHMHRYNCSIAEIATYFSLDQELIAKILGDGVNSYTVVYRYAAHHTVGKILDLVAKDPERAYMIYSHTGTVVTMLVKLAQVCRWIQPKVTMYGHTDASSGYYPIDGRLLLFDNTHKAKFAAYLEYVKTAGSSAYIGTDATVKFWWLADSPLKVPGQRPIKPDFKVIHDDHMSTYVFVRPYVDKVVADSVRALRKANTSGIGETAESYIIVTPDWFNRHAILTMPYFDAKKWKPAYCWFPLAGE